MVFLLVRISNTAGCTLHWPGLACLYFLQSYLPVLAYTYIITNDTICIIARAFSKGSSAWKCYDINIWPYHLNFLTSNLDLCISWNFLTQLHGTMLDPTLANGNVKARPAHHSVAPCISAHGLRDKRDPIAMVSSSQMAPSKRCYFWLG